MYQKEFNFIEKSLNNLSLKDSLQLVCEFLQKNVVGYDWVGFYFHDKNKHLILKSYSGLKTEHTKIPFGKGICGQTAESNKPIIVDDVSSESNYISCNINVKSEIVVPLFVNGKNIGQIDIDSNTTDPFTDVDERFLEFVCQLVATLM